MQTEPVHLRFVGPFSWLGPPDALSLFESAECKQPGIYVWTVPLPEGHLIYYVGETGRSFASRMLEHYMQHAAGFYHVNSPLEFAAGRKVRLWPGRYDPDDRKSPVDCMRQSIALAAEIAALTQIFRFLLAPIARNARTRHRVEAAIDQVLRETPGRVGRFPEKGVHYRPRTGDEADLVHCSITSSVKLLGLPAELMA